MARLTPEEMERLTTVREKRATELKKLMEIPFDPNNKIQMAELTKLINHFEFFSHQMSIYDALSTGLFAGFGGWFLGYLIPTPQLINTALSYAIWIGLGSFFLEDFRLNDYSIELEEMKTVFNWCFKGGEEKYEAIDNTNKLLNPELQNLFKLLAPLCLPKFLIVWPRVTESSKVESNGWLNVRSLAVTALSSTFFSTPKNSTDAAVDLTQLIPFKTAVETGHFRKNEMQKLESAVQYFMYSPLFREILSTKAVDLFGLLKTTIPSILSPSTSLKI